MKDKEALRQGLKANPKLKHTEDCYPQLNYNNYKVELL